MGWLRLSVTCRSNCIDDLSELLEKFDAGSLSITPASNEAIFADGDIVEQYWEHSSVTGLFSEDIDLDILLACIRSCIGDDSILDYSISPLANQEWTENFKQGFSPLVFSSRLCICPSWCNPPREISNVVKLDPGLAFGTGAHPTTWLCLDWLARQDLKGRSIVDYGCGSGILALAAASLGAARVIAVDIDQQALNATAANAENNGLADRVETVHPDSYRGNKTDVLLANILLSPLIKLAPVFRSVLKESGQLVLSGLLATQAEECLASYRDWVKFDPPVFRDEWAMLSGTNEGVG